MSLDEHEGWGSAVAGVAESAWMETAPPREAADKQRQMDQAYDEYCRQRRRGENPDPDAFCQRFPFASSLHRLLEVETWGNELAGADEKSQASRWPSAGECFLGFDLERELGRGAFARVFLATEPALGNRRVAVKVARQGGAEAETLGRLNHPNIVAVYSVKKDLVLGLTAVCMPYVGGANLLHLLDRLHSGLPATAEAIQNVIDEALAPHEAVRRACWTKHESYVAAVVRIGEQLAAGLASSHAQGVYHQDLKPENVLLAADGRAMLLDFNLSFDAEASEPRLGGSLLYMSPEQLAAVGAKAPAAETRVDARSDLFSLGVLLYQLLAGTHPFGPAPLKMSLKEARVFLRQRHLEGPRPLHQVNPRVGKAVARIIEHCLAADPADRPRSAAELGAALRRAQPIGSRIHRWVANHVRTVAVIAMLVLAAGVTGALGTYSLTARPSRTAEEWAEKGRAYYKNGQYTNAVECFDEALKRDERNWEVTYALGRAYLKRGDEKACMDAARYFERADKLYVAANGDDKHYGSACASRAYCLNLMRYHAEAIELYSYALAAGHETAELQNNLGYSRLFSSSALNRPEENAEAAFNRALLIDNRLQAAYINRAELHITQVGQWLRFQPGSAYDDMEKAIAIGPATPSLYFEAARVHALAYQVHGKRSGVGHKIGRFRIGNSAFETVALVLEDAQEAEFHHAQAVRFAREALQRGYKRDQAQRDLYLKPLIADVGNIPVTLATPEIELRLVDPVPEGNIDSPPLNHFDP